MLLSNLKLLYQSTRSIYRELEFPVNDGFGPKRRWTDDDSGDGVAGPNDETTMPEDAPESVRRTGAQSCLI